MKITVQIVMMILMMLLVKMLVSVAVDFDNDVVGVAGVFAYDVNDNVAIVHSAGKKCSANCHKREREANNKTVNGVERV